MFPTLLIPLLLVLVLLPNLAPPAAVVHAYDLGLFEPPPLGDLTPGLQLQLYKYYSKLHSIPNLDARRPDLVTWLPLLNQPARFGTWPEVYALRAATTPGFERYDGATYGLQWAARITGQLLVDKTNTFMFDLENREGAKLWIDGRLAVDNDFNALEQPVGTKRKYAHVHLTAGYHQLRVDFFVDVTYTSLILRYSAPGLARQILPAERLFLPRGDCCLCNCRGGQCRVSDTDTGAVDCLWPSDATLPAAFPRPLLRDPNAAPERDTELKRTCEHPCEDPGAAASIDDRQESVHTNYGSL